ncbi:histidine kinase [uncultured Oscillibacter sp.]|uniref:cache domain-containing sensor histidine kinase n=1 Tax=uncultured Oscillibacter sp. TaxID=876091 RepID=UPI002803AEC9|nr:histidine kinase [uncultured Oscillibacter sp.]
MQHLKHCFSALCLRQKIYLLTLLALVAIVLIVTFGSAMASRSVMSINKQAMQAEIGNVENYFRIIDGVITDNTEKLATSIGVEKLLADAETHQGGTWSIYSLMSDILNNEVLQSVSLYTGDGKLTAHVYNESAGLAASDLPDEILAALHSDSDGTVWIDHAGGRQYACVGSAVIYRMFQSALSPYRMGIVRFELSLTNLSEYYASLMAGDTYELYLYDQNGKVLLPRTIRSGVWQVTQEGFNLLHSGEKDSLAPFSAVMIPFRSERYCVLASPLSYGNYTAVACVSESSVLQSIHVLQVTIFAVGAACVLVMLLFMNYMANMLTAPIEELAARMRQVEQGDLSIRSENQSPDEIGNLAQNFNRMLDDIQELIWKSQKAEEERHYLWLNSLQLQIVPHFLYNSLDGISSLIQIGDKENAFAMSQSLSQFYRSTLSSGRTIITLKEELTLTESYLQVQSQRYRNRFDYYFETDPSIEDVATVKLTLQPLVENAIYHGLRNVRRHGLLEIIARAEGEDVVLSVRDNGKGMECDEILLMERDHAAGDMILRTHGYGMSNVDRRIKLYFGENYGLHIESQPGSWTRVDVRFPRREAEEFQNDNGTDR